MANGPLYRVAFRRRLSGATDYRARLGLLKSRKTRVVVRASTRNVVIQFVNYDEKGDLVLAQAEARELASAGYKGGSNTPSAYLAGILAAKRAKEAGITECVLDIGRANPHKGGVLFGALKGIVDGGLNVPHGDDVFPSDDRIRAEHLGEEKAAAFAASYEKIAGKPLGPKAEKPKKAKKGDSGKGKAAPPAKGGGKPAGEKKAKTPK